MKKLFTTEAVTSGHPDKMCDLIADAILDAYLKEDENSRVACEVVASKNQILIMGEITSKAKIDVESIARKIICDIGYDNDELGFNGNNIKIITDLNKQSSDIALGVDKEDTGAGDQGIMYGYATNETDNYMPLVHNLSCSLVKRLEIVRKTKEIKGLRPDGKAQITLEDNNGSFKIKTIVISAQHDDNIDLEILRNEIIHKVIKNVINDDLIDRNTEILINPTGRFVIGGPVGDSGLTGRKICVDTYGGITPHGGGAFSGKDYTKVDRSAAYYARYVAKNVVASGLADKCLISVSYAIGVSEPLMVELDSFNTGKYSDEELLKIVKKVFNFKPSNIIKELDLKHLKYQDTTLYSHFGKDNLSYENLDKIEFLTNF